MKKDWFLCISKAPAGLCCAKVDLCSTMSLLRLADPKSTVNREMLRLSNCLLESAAAGGHVRLIEGGLVDDWTYSACRGTQVVVRGGVLDDGLLSGGREGKVGP